MTNSPELLKEQDSFMELNGVLPLKVSGTKDRYNLFYANILVRSLDRFWKGSGRCRLTVVVLPHEYNNVRHNLLSTSNVLIEIVSENDIVPELEKFPNIHGWYKQMIIKLAFSRYIKTTFYMTFDADMMCVRPLDMADLVHNGRAVSQWEEKSIHPEWWQASRSLLYKADSGRIMGLSVTPNMLSAEIARQTLGLLTERRKMSAAYCLLNHSDFRRLIWTEYSLYTEAAEELGLIEIYHQPPGFQFAGRPACIHTECNLWTATGIASWRPVEWVRETSHGHFLVFQSSLGLSPDDLRSIVEYLLT